MHSVEKWRGHFPTAFEVINDRFTANVSISSPIQLSSLCHSSYYYLHLSWFAQKDVHVFFSLHATLLMDEFTFSISSFKCSVKRRMDRFLNIQRSIASFRYVVRQYLVVWPLKIMILRRWVKFDLKLYYYTTQKEICV